MTRRLRIAGVVIQPILAWDDGDELTSGPEVQPQNVSLSKAADVLARLPAEVERIEAELLSAAEGEGGDAG